MPRRKQARRTTVKDLRSILRLTHEQGLSVRAVKAGVAKALWFEPTLNQTFAIMAEHYDTTILPTRSRKPRDKGKVEGAVLIVERWVLARLRNRRFFSLGDLNAAIAVLLAEQPPHAPCRQKPPGAVRGDRTNGPVAIAAGAARICGVEIGEGACRLPCRDRQAIGRRVDVRLTHRVVELFHDHKRVASHVRRSQRCGHVTVNEHMPKAHQRHANTTPANLIRQAAGIGANTAILVERMMRDRPHPEQGYRSAFWHPLAGPSLRAGSARGGLRAGTDHQCDHLLLCQRHPQIRPRPRAARSRAGQAHAIAHQHPRRLLLSMKEGNQPC